LEHWNNVKTTLVALPFVGNIRDGLLASRGRLQKLTFCVEHWPGSGGGCVHGDDDLQELVRIYTSTQQERPHHRAVTTTTTTTTTTNIIHGYYAEYDAIIVECNQRNKLRQATDATMKNPRTVPRTAWPVALARCSPPPSPKKTTKTMMIPLNNGPTATYRLVLKMLEADVFDHTAPVCRF
jgi:hypothetical protein